MECFLEQAPQLSQVSILIRQDPTIQIQTNVSNTPPYNLASSISSGTLSIFTVGHYPFLQSDTVKKRSDTIGAWVYYPYLYKRLKVSIR